MRYIIHVFVFGRRDQPAAKRANSPDNSNMKQGSRNHREMCKLATARPLPSGGIMDDIYDAQYVNGVSSRKV
jgi:hypothetical protein